MYVFATDFVPDFTEAYLAMADSFGRLNMPEMVDYSNGMVSYSMKEYDQALELLHRSEAAKKDYAGTYVGLGFTYEALGEYENALAAYKKAIELNPANFSAINGAQRIELMLQN